MIRLPEPPTGDSSIAFRRGPHDRGFARPPKSGAANRKRDRRHLTETSMLASPSQEVRVEERKR